jgi:hypothetical protein
MPLRTRPRGRSTEPARAAVIPIAKRLNADRTASGPVLRVRRASPPTPTNSSTRATTQIASNPNPTESMPGIEHTLTGPADSCAAAQSTPLVTIETLCPAWVTAAQASRVSALMIPTAASTGASRCQRSTLRSQPVDPVVTVEDRSGSPRRTTIDKAAPSRIKASQRPTSAALSPRSAAGEKHNTVSNATAAQA